MTFLVTGTNYRISPIELREQLVTFKKGRRNALHLLKALPWVRGGFILSTCNRFEIYILTEDRGPGREALFDFILRHYELTSPLSRDYFYTYEGMNAFTHLSRVASGLDSQIPGELQILSQVREAYEEAEREGVESEETRHFVESSLRIAREVHRRTDISKGRVSIGSVARDFLKDRCGSITGKKILLIGAGRVAELILKYLRGYISDGDLLVVSNKNKEKAQRLADLAGGRVIDYPGLSGYMYDVDIIISATDSPHTVLKKEILPPDRGKDLVMLDLAVPRDIDPGVATIAYISLYTLSDLDVIIKKNIELKREAARRAEVIIRKMAEEIWKEELLSGQERVIWR